MSKTKKKEEFKERDEIEEYFSEVKNKSFPIGIIFIIIFLLIVGCFSYYYFVIDSPKNIFLTVINNTLNSINYQKHEKINYEFSLDTSIETTNKENAAIIDIIEEIALTGIGGVDLNNKQNFSKLNTFYKGEELLSVDTYYQNDNFIYLKSDDLYDKVIQMSVQEQENNTQNSDEQIDNLTKLINSIKEVLKTNLNKASYQKEYTDLNDTKVKKVTLLLDKKFLENIYNDLLNNNDFIESYSKLTDTDTLEVKKEIQNEINKIDNETQKISLYLSILENKFLMLETISDEERITITKEENKYSYKIYNNSIIEYQGYFEILKTNNDYEISISYDDIKEELNVILNLNLSLEYDKDIESMDIDNAVNYETLTENDFNKIMNNLYQNKTFINLYQDINTLFQDDNNNNQEQVTTTA